MNSYSSICKFIKNLFFLLYCTVQFNMIFLSLYMRQGCKKSFFFNTNICCPKSPRYWREPDQYGGNDGSSSGRTELQAHARPLLRQSHTASTVKIDKLSPVALPPTPFDTRQTFFASLHMSQKSQYTLSRCLLTIVASPVLQIKIACCRDNYRKTIIIKVRWEANVLEILPKPLCIFLLTKIQHKKV